MVYGLKMKVFGCFKLGLIIPLIFALISTSQAAPIDIKGKVVETGQSIKIEHEGNFSPIVGDPVEIGFMLGEDFLPLDSKWKIVKVDARFAWAQKSGGQGEDPAENYIVVIRSANPQKRSIPSTPQGPQSKKILYCLLIILITTIAVCGMSKIQRLMKVKLKTEIW